SSPSPSLKLSDLTVHNYHGNFIYNMGEPDAKVRPYFFGGLGATHYSPGDINPLLPGAGTGNIDGATKFSTDWGLGVKMYAGSMIGFKAGVRWTPTYIKSDTGGIWCDPFYPTCWVIADLDYSNQFEFTGGITLRFGAR